MRREWIEIKFPTDYKDDTCKSPSMRREWIEMVFTSSYHSHLSVSLHAEGVD